MFSAGGPGPGLEVARWVIERGLCLTGGDTSSVEVVPNLGAGQYDGAAWRRDGAVIADLPGQLLVLLAGLGKVLGERSAREECCRHKRRQRAGAVKSFRHFPRMGFFLQLVLQVAQGQIQADAKTENGIPGFSLIRIFQQLADQPQRRGLPLADLDAAPATGAVMTSLPVAKAGVGSAVGDVYRQRAAAEYNAHGNCRALFVRTARQLALLTRTFFGRLFESELIPPGLGQVQVVTSVFAFLAAPSLLILDEATGFDENERTRVMPLPTQRYAA